MKPPIYLVWVSRGPWPVDRDECPDLITRDRQEALDRADALNMDAHAYAAVWEWNGEQWVEL